MKEPQVEVGILSAESIVFKLLSDYEVEGIIVSGLQKVEYKEGIVLWNGQQFTQLLFKPVQAETATFELFDVTIGINFHWQRKENQRFQGSLKIIAGNRQLVAINIIGVEHYLTSVISSEMSASASLELLKAHAVISRSWLLNILERRRKSEMPTSTCEEESDGTLLKWYSNEDHKLFDVCADDHCQRYQGITRASTDTVRQAIAATYGEVLSYGQEICDARFSKCCGGMFEEFQYCWEKKEMPYLQKGLDAANDSHCPNLQIEAEAEQWIRTSPPAFCNTNDKHILSQVLNNYDQETNDFFRWEVRYTQQELADLLLKRTGVDYGIIYDLKPLARGTSGRLWKLEIKGSKSTQIIGKELEIRRSLSATHLYSSAFVVDKKDISAQGIPQRFVITGAGWGHGVGLCQIGAAVMGEQGYAYHDILLHYYKGASITRLYK